MANTLITLTGLLIEQRGRGEGGDVANTLIALLVS